ncbi:hypothetical protein AJ80_01942 [Polytolypa hystricis UAMH7299]|uniref:PRISE-like Rossmann-fold domain-containing protein n=1 Tax=Polytolypa hystricis (strain UAMH7299) TaxID=1447883 RepID=A0A2B7YR06_POLH7|nr:hypothetical protein AJ80_01942 [Polytolypa hystricis UAMH7299]
MAGHHALVFGASGITGWAITNQILSGYPSPGTFSKVTALTNRPLSDEAAQWPKSDKLQLVSGLNLLNEGGVEALKKEMQERVKDISTVSHVYFFAYIMDSDSAKEIEVNVRLISNAVSAIDQLSSNLKFVVMPTGTKAYGVHLLDKFPFPTQLPLKESLPRIPEPYASEMFYFSQIDKLKELSKGKSWTWSEIIPDIIIGFVPNNNVYCLAQALALYLSLYAEVEGKGAEVPFPGTEESWKILSNDSSQDVIAKFSIDASLNPAKTGGERFNVCDNATASSWSVKWPVVCSFFGLVGVPPPPGGSGPQPYAYLEEHLAEWKKLEKKHGLQTGRVGNDRSAGSYPHFLMTLFNFDRHLDITKMHSAWGDQKAETDTKGAYWTAFERFRKAKIIP